MSGTWTRSRGYDAGRAHPAVCVLYTRHWHLTFFTRKTLATSDSPVILRPLLRYPAGTSVAVGVRVVGVRGDGAEISGAQVIDAADELGPVRVRLIRTHAAIRTHPVIAGWLSDGPA